MRAECGARFARDAAYRLGPAVADPPVGQVARVACDDPEPGCVCGHGNAAGECEIRETLNGRTLLVQPRGAALVIGETWLAPVRDVPGPVGGDQDRDK